MPRTDFNSLQAFILVARERSFTRAAAQLGVSQSALSHAMRALEARLEVRLLARTTRGVAPTEAGERLYAELAPHYEGIEAGLAALDAARGRPAGTIRITAHDHAAGTVLWPRLSKALAAYPEVKVEINIEYGMIDIGPPVLPEPAPGFAGVRAGAGGAAARLSCKAERQPRS